MPFSKRIVFRDPTSASLWADTPGVLVTTVLLRFDIDAVELSVEGVARGTPNFEIEATAGDSAVVASVTSQAAVALFRTSLQLQSVDDGCTLVVRSGSLELDRVALNSPHGDSQRLPAAASAGLESSRRQFLAGTSDRTFERRSFSLLEKAPFGTAHALVARSVRADDLSLVGLSPEVPVKVIDVTTLGKAVDGRFRELHSSQTSQTKLQRRQARIGVFKQSVQEASAAQNDSPRLGWLGKASKSPAADFTRHRTASGMEAEAALPLVATADEKIYLIVRHDMSSEDIAVWIDDVATKYLSSRFGDRIGVLFSDRLRYRPAGLVVGEQLYTLALTPGEEVQVRQTVETKRQAKIEQIEDREEERSLTLSSTWSTDLSQSLTDTETLQMTLGGSLGANVGPFTISSVSIPISGSGGVSGSIADAHTWTSQRSQQVHQQMSAQAAEKLRRQHKTRIEITTEENSALAVTRTIRNANLQRPVSYIFSKVYRREQVTLERHAGRLCLRLVVKDPSKPFREQFCRVVSRMDPANPSNYPSAKAAEPEVVELSEEISVDLPYSNPHALGPPNIQDMAVHQITWPASSGAAAFPAGVSASRYALIGTPSITLLSFTNFDNGGRYYHPVHEGVFTSESYFWQLYGSIEWVQPGRLGLESSLGPVVGVNSFSHSIGVAANRFPYYEHLPGSPGMAWYVAGISTVKFRVSGRFKLIQPAEVARDDQREAVRRELVAALTTDALISIRRAIVGDFFSSVLSTAMIQHVMSEASRPIDEIRHVFDFDDAIVEVTPHFAHPLGLAAHEELRTLLQQLPVSIDSARVISPELVAAEAVVFLPVSAGSEQEALALLDGLEQWERDWLVDEITRYRAIHFAPTASTLPIWREVVGPVPPTGTPVGSSQWQTSWEEVPKSFDVLSAWQELVPTDGVHIDAVASDSVPSDEQRVRALSEGK